MSEAMRASVAEAQQSVSRHDNVNNVIPTKVGIQDTGEVYFSNSLDPHFRGDDDTPDFFTGSSCR